MEERNNRTTRIFLLLVLSINFSSVVAEDIVALPLTELCVQAQFVYEAKYLSKDADTYTFCGHQAGSRRLYADTFRIANIEDLYEVPAVTRGVTPCIENADRILLFIEKRDGSQFKLVHTGARILRDGKVYNPQQGLSFDKLGFYQFDPIRWSELTSRVIDINQRMQRIKKIRTIRDPVVRSKRLVTWLHKHIDTFTGFEGEYPNGDTGWGSIEYEILDWIKKAGIPEDIDRAKALFDSRVKK